MHGFDIHHGRHGAGLRFGSRGMRDGHFERGGHSERGERDGSRNHGEGGRRTRRFDGEELRLLVLGLLQDAPQHGYQLIRSFAEKSGNIYQPSPGVLYPLLTMLADMGLITKVEAEGTRRCYMLTSEGEAELVARRDVVDSLIARLAALAELAERMDRAPVRRAIHNLRSAIVERLGREAASSELGFEVARLIDEVTQKIERL